MFYRRYPLSTFTQQSLTLVNKFLDQTASRYLDPESDGIATADDDSFQSNGWATIVVAVEGSTVATNVIQAENVLHIEAIPDKNGISTATPRRRLVLLSWNRCRNYVKDGRCVYGYGSAFVSSRSIACCD